MGKWWKPYSDACDIEISFIEGSQLQSQAWALNKTYFWKLHSDGLGLLLGKEERLSLLQPCLPLICLQQNGLLVSRTLKPWNQYIQSGKDLHLQGPYRGWGEGRKEEGLPTISPLPSAMPPGNLICFEGVPRLGILRSLGTTSPTISSSLSFKGHRQACESLSHPWILSHTLIALLCSYMITPKYSSAPAKSSPAHRQKGNEVVAIIDQPWTLVHPWKHLAVVLRSCISNKLYYHLRRQQTTAIGCLYTRGWLHQQSWVVVLSSPS